MRSFLVLVLAVTASALAPSNVRGAIVSTPAAASRTPAVEMGAKKAAKKGGVNPALFSTGIPESTVKRLEAEKKKVRCTPPSIRHPVYSGCTRSDAPP